MKEKEILDTQKNLNKKLAKILKENQIRNIRLVSLGNSIASGYSMSRITKPLLLRNESIEDIMKSNNIKLERHNFARAQNNSDEHLFEWLVTNIKESEINKMNRSDYMGGPTSMVTYGLDKVKMEEFYPIDMNKDMGLQDLVCKTKDDLANILIYNGCTGSFLDNVTRNGKLTSMLTYGIKRDITSLEATLKYIQSNNRKNNANTQVYICGAPNFLGLNITGLINNKLKKVARRYANTTYVDPVKSKFIYKNCETGKLQPDIHYDEEEYKQFNKNIIEAIINNYEVNKAMINLDRNFYIISSYIELERPSLNKDNKILSEYINIELAKQEKVINKTEHKANFYKKAKEYLLERAPYDFFYLGKKNIKNATKIKLIDR